MLAALWFEGSVKLVDVLAARAFDADDVVAALGLGELAAATAAAQRFVKSHLQILTWLDTIRPPVQVAAYRCRLDLQRGVSGGSNTRHVAVFSSPR